MSQYIQRTCTPVGNECVIEQSCADSLPLKNYVNEDVFVLLGGPGAGKTVAFKQEAKRTKGCYVSARDFIVLEPQSQWVRRTLFIDGFDEVRAGSFDSRTPFDEIRKKLDYLGQPRFRLSCRADWLGLNDRSNLEFIAPKNKILMLWLDPLSAQDIKDFLCEKLDSKLADEFMKSAVTAGADRILQNPQILNLLIDGFKEHGLPGSRRQVFELACHMALRDNNQVQVVHTRYAASDLKQNLVEKLCTYLLLTGSHEFRLNRNEMLDSEILSAGLIQFDASENPRRTLSGQLFKPSQVSDECLVPVHQQFVEFLAANYLTKKIDTGLRAKTVLSLITGNDGGIVTSLRGLAAWLAVHCNSLRVELIQRDPLGTLLNGDIAEFTANEKLALLTNLAQEIVSEPWILQSAEFTSRLGDIAPFEMNTEFRSIFTSSNVGKKQNFLTLLALKTFQSWNCIPEMSDIFTDIVRDSKRAFGIRERTLRLLIKYHSKNDNHTAIKSLMSEIVGRQLWDPGDQLLGILLTALYPKSISPSETVQYLRPPKSSGFIGSFHRFWSHDFFESTPSGSISLVLDALVSQRNRMQEQVSDLSYSGSKFLRHVPVEMLRRYLEQASIKPEPAQLYRWLEVAASLDPISSSTPEGESIRNWFKNHPDLQKMIFKFGVEEVFSAANHTDIQAQRHTFWKLRTRFFASTTKKEFGAWYLERACESRSPDIAEFYTQTLADWFKASSNHEDISEAIILEKLADSPQLRDFFETRITELEQTEAKELELTAQYNNERSQRQAKWQRVIAEHEHDLSKNRGNTQLMHKLAGVFLGNYVNFQENTPRERMYALLGEERLGDLVIQGLRGTLWRDDMPDHGEIIQFHAKDQIHYLALPAVAGLYELTGTDQSAIEILDQEQIKTLFAICFLMQPTCLENDTLLNLPNWLRLLLDSHMEIAAEILIKCEMSKVHANQKFGLILENFNYPILSKSVASSTSLLLLNAAPVRCTDSQMDGLRYSLYTAVRHCDSGAVLDLVNKKLTSLSMNIAQRVCWLATGLLIAQESYLLKLDSYISGNERRIRHLTEYMVRFNSDTQTFSNLEVQALEFLIETIGYFNHPISIKFTEEDGAGSNLTLRLLEQLANFSSKEADIALRNLLASDRLSRWRSQILQIIKQQNTLLRNATYEYPTLDELNQIFST